ncbi:MAG: alanine racemase [Acidobacteriota bacterium]|nr:alanine racemase [Acidobacteriota bacterium]
MTSWLEISAGRLTQNYQALSAAAGADVPVLAVIKANAYGHGLALCGPVLARAGAPWLGVQDVEEGVQLRRALAAHGVSVAQQPRILIMGGPLPADSAALLEHNLTPIVWTIDQLEALHAALHSARPTRGHGEPFDVHLEIDTGMGRQGVAPGEPLQAVLAWLLQHPALRLQAVMTHFASTEVAHCELTTLQRERMERAMGAITRFGFRPEIVHVGNTSMVDNGEAAPGEGSSVVWLKGVAARAGAQPMVRAGIGLYGYCLPVEGSDTAASLVRRKLLPVVTWRAAVLAVAELAPGATVGYNGTFVATAPMRVALVGVGYANGLRRELSSGAAGGWMLVAGQRARILGRVSMNLTVLDVTGIDDVAMGDAVVVLGDGITADDHARLARTISYEILCGLRGTHRLVE